MQSIAIDNLINEMRNNGLAIDHIIRNNKINRCPEINSKSKFKKPCWYRVFDNGTSMVVVYGNYKTNGKWVWSDGKGNKISAAETHTKYMELAKHQQVESQQTLANLRNRYAKEIKPLTNHAYLDKKQITPLLIMSMKYKLGIDGYDNLVIPVLDIDGQIMGWQTISANATADKYFTKGTMTKGNCYPIIAEALTLRDLDMIFIGEGFATMASVYLALNEVYDSKHIACIVTFGVNNIESVLLNLWKHNINKPTTLIADNDIGSDNNIGKTTCELIQRRYPLKSLKIYTPEMKGGTNE
jgi:phage/plasmid primase-like uncharacterized protein